MSFTLCMAVSSQQKGGAFAAAVKTSGKAFYRGALAAVQQMAAGAQAKASGDPVSVG
jgi:spore coat polysaccharide biosynthesis protein SpsF (cytidylyltransferase family)